MNSGGFRNANSNHRDRGHHGNNIGHNNLLRGLGISSLSQQAQLLQNQTGTTISVVSGGTNSSSNVSSSVKQLHHPSQQHNKHKKSNNDAANPKPINPDHNLVSPIRQTASIFKQPVTVFKEHKSKVKADLKAVNREKPTQLFWVKRLGNLSPVSFKPETPVSPPPVKKGPPPEIEIMETDDMAPFKLPKRVETVGPDVSNKMLLASISTHLHLSKDAAYGQSEASDTISKNPTAFINPAQPLMLSMTVSDADITAAENRVRMARAKLAQAVKSVTV